MFVVHEKDLQFVRMQGALNVALAKAVKRVALWHAEILTSNLHQDARMCVAGDYDDEMITITIVEVVDSVPTQMGKAKRSALVEECVTAIIACRDTYRVAEATGVKDISEP